MQGGTRVLWYEAYVLSKVQRWWKMNDIKMTKLEENKYALDACGLVCPFPQVLADRALGELKVGDTLELRLDSEKSLKDIPSNLKKKGHEVSASYDADAWKITIVKKN